MAAADFIVIVTDISLVVCSTLASQTLLAFVVVNYEYCSFF